MTTTLNPSLSTAAAVPPVWRKGLTAGVAAATATTSIAVLARAAGVSFDSDGKGIPAAGFAQLTLVFTVIGLLIARTIGRRARAPRAMFVKVTVALTALSLVPDVLLSTDVASKLVLMLTHLVAAAIVIPVVARQLADQR